jgi:sigma-E factor negative regulatory protein RseC
MIEEQGKVVALQKDWVWVETQRKSACGQCSVNKGCGTSVLADVFGKKSNSIAVVKTLPVKVGDEVVIGIEENTLVKGSLLIYALPLILLIAFGLLGEVVGNQVFWARNDAVTVLFAGLGLGVGFLWLRHISSRLRLDPRYQPKLLQIKNTISFS